MNFAEWEMNMVLLRDECADPVAAIKEETTMIS
jgi:hypothetical protein